MRGLFITFEGLDGSGKSTHLDRATRWLEDSGVPVTATREPGGTPIGRELRSLFLDARRTEMDPLVETLLLFASRRQHLIEVIDPALEAGRHVLCDRFTDSTVAYQGYGRGLDLEAIAQIDRLATGGRRPDLTLLFDLPAEVARGRGQSATRRASPDGLDRLDSEELAFYERVRRGYLEIAAGAADRFRSVDSTGEEGSTARQVRHAIEGLIEVPG